MKTTIDRAVASRLLAKTVAYIKCGKPDLANQYAAALVRYLVECGIDLSRAESSERDEELVRRCS